MRLGCQGWLVLVLCSSGVGCGGGRSGMGEDEQSDGGTSFELGGASFGGKGSVTSKGGTTSLGGAIASTGGYATGGRATGGRATGGYIATGGFATTGGRTTGGTGAYGGMGQGGKAQGGAGGVISPIGASAGVAAMLPNGGTAGVAGKSPGGAGSAFGGAGGAGGASGGAGGVGGAGGALGGAGGATGGSSCNPWRASAGASGNADIAAAAGQFAAAGNSGAIGSGSTSEWFVDAKNGSDVGPGTEAQPLKTLSCAAVAARAGDTVSLLDGTWDPSVDGKLGNTLMTDCGVDSGIAFASDVKLRAVHEGAVRIVGGGYHAICMSGGAIEGIRLECRGGRPIVESRAGTLAITGTSWRSCGYFGLDVSGTANVTLRPGGLEDYAEYANAQFAIARDQSRLTVEGGKLSYQSIAFWVEGNAALWLNGVAIQSAEPTVNAGQAVYLVNGTPRLTITGGTSFANVSLGILTSSVTSDITVDDMKFLNGSNAFIVTETPGTFVPKIAINRLTVVDASSLGVNVSGTFDLSITNSTFTRVGAPAVIPSGAATVLLDNVTFVDGWGGMIFSSGTEKMSVKVRNVTAIGGQYSGIAVSGDADDTLDFGTLASPGNNVLRGNNVGNNDGNANFAFSLAAGAVISAVGNTWDANVQGADVDGRYSVGSTSTALLVSSGVGPNYVSSADNAGQLLLAGSR